MMGEWKKINIGELGRIVTGKTPSSKKPELFGDRFPFITPTDMHNRRFASETQRYLSAEGAASQKTLKVPAGSVAVSCIGWQMGKSILTSRPSFTNQQLHTIIPNESVNPQFLYYSLCTRREELLSLGSAGGVRTPIVNKTAFSLLPLLLPPLDTQRKIASLLSVYDDLIENNTRRIAILEEMARLVYREWFVSFRFPGHENVELMDSPLGEQIPVGWETTELGSCLSVLETGNRPKGGVSEIKDGIPSIGAESIVGAGVFDFSKTKYIPFDYFKRLKKGIVEDRDVLVYKDGGKPGYFIPHVSFFGSGFPFELMALNSHVYRLRGNDRASQEFLYYHISSEEMMQWMHLNGSGAAIPSIARKDLVRMPVNLPPLEVMQRFTDFTGGVLSEILVLAKRTQNLRTTRDLLLPKLISGKLDVEDLDIDTGDLNEELEETTA